MPSAHNVPLIKRWGYFLTFIPICTLVWLHKFFPRSLFPCSLKLTIYLLYLLRLRRTIVANNIAIAFPHFSAAKQAATVKASYFFVGEVLTFLIDCANSSAIDIKERTKISGLAHLQQAQQAERSGLCIAGHVGIAHIALLLPLYGIPISLFRARVHNPYYHHWIDSVLQKFGATLLDPTDNAGLAMAKRLKAESFLGLIIDLAFNGGQVAPFFNRRAEFGTGVYRLAGRMNRPMFYCLGRVCTPYHYEFQVEPFCLDTHAYHQDQEAFVTAQLTRYIARLEESITATPEQYFWLHNRWKKKLDNVVAAE